MALTIRETQAGDIENLFSVRARTRQNPASKEWLATQGITPASMAARMASGEEKGWSCFDDDTLVGFCSAEGASGEVVVLAVLPEYEGKGIGKRLLSCAVEWLRSHGFEQPWLAASPDPNIRGHGFYRALGWKPTGRCLANGDEILQLPNDTAQE